MALYGGWRLRIPITAECYHVAAQSFVAHSFGDSTARSQERWTERFTQRPVEDLYRAKPDLRHDLAFGETIGTVGETR